MLSGCGQGEWWKDGWWLRVGSENGGSSTCSLGSITIRILIIRGLVRDYDA